MPIVESMFAALRRDPRLWAQVADHATSAAPAWLWRADGTGILWANAAGAAIFSVEPALSSTRRRWKLLVLPQPCRRRRKRGSSACAALVEASAAPSPAHAGALRRRRARLFLSSPRSRSVRR
jgi:hypothetical protein